MSLLLADALVGSTGAFSLYNECMEKHIKEVILAVEHINSADLRSAVTLLSRVRATGGTVWLVGNGGSAATASHFANDLTKMAGMKAVSIPEMVPTMLAFGNDLGWEFMFSNIVAHVAVAGDVLVAISCSGNSPNVVNAVRVARERLCDVLALTNDKTNALSIAQPNVLLRARHHEITVQEDIHSIVCHAIARELAGAMYL